MKVVSLPNGDEWCLMVQLRVVCVPGQSGVQMVVVDDACLCLEMAESQNMGYMLSQNAQVLWKWCVVILPVLLLVDQHH